MNALPYGKTPASLAFLAKLKLRLLAELPLTVLVKKLIRHR